MSDLGGRIVDLFQTQKNRLLFRVPVFLFDRVLFSVEADQFSELHRLLPESAFVIDLLCLPTVWETKPNLSF
ncbi:hypothetical protein [Thalassolituus marinus]|uniref:Uncharacterized protein n=1 Tax=Thalassolituus marinus TaxID=671053 RepID=A0ABS7ZMK0_9GAMM|nr:hypothetical protein [Thalassolituus marinus]MCA6062939.1 hypothetical protein [Thalassolituus marinus]